MLTQARGSVAYGDNVIITGTSVPTYNITTSYEVIGAFGAGEALAMDNYDNKRAREFLAGTKQPATCLTSLLLLGTVNKYPRATCEYGTNMHTCA
jgi:hypothetical protein